MSVADTPHANQIIQAIESFSSSLSFFGCIITSYFIIKEKKYNQLTNRLLLYLLGLDFTLSIAYGVGLSGDNNNGFCQFQALIVQWIGLAGILWVSYMSFQMYLWVVKKRNPNQLIKTMNYHFLLILSSTGILGIVLLSKGYYGPAGVWCWILITHSRLRFYCFYIILLAAWVFMIITLNYVSISLRKRVTSTTTRQSIQSIDTASIYPRSSINVISDNDALHNSEKIIQRKLATYIFVFVFVWFFGLLNRFIGYLYNQSMFSTTLLQAAFLPLQGFLNSIFYGNLFIIINPYNIIDYFSKINQFFNDTSNNNLRHSLNNKPNTNNIELVSHNIMTTNESTKYYPSNYQPKLFSIFTTTLNFGEASYDSVINNMNDWIVKGHDIYVICFQECLDIINLKSFILDYINNNNDKITYVGFNNEIGSSNTQLGYHGYIGLFVYIKQTDLDNGFVVPTIASTSTMATGMNLLVTTAQNKGAVGLPFQIHDTSIGFVSCHLPSDSKGTSKLLKRNASAQSLIRELNLTNDDIGFDIQLQHDHVVVLGDLNYRTDTDEFGGGYNLLEGVAQACIIEKNILTSSNTSNLSWLKQKYNLLRVTTDPLFPNENERKLLLQAKSKSRSHWLSVISADELRMIMEDGDAFLGFYEPFPCFPPSYKRRKGLSGDCGDYTDTNAIVKGFSHTGTEEIQLFSQNHSISSNNNELINGLDISDDSFNQSSDESSKKVFDQDLDNRSRSQTQSSSVSYNANNSTNVNSSSSNSSKIRPPSFTDRILIHSLDDRRERLTIQAYDMCDSMRASDHRPVSMTMLLEVNDKVRFPENAETQYRKKRLGITIGLFELSIIDLLVYFGRSLTDVIDNDIDNSTNNDFDVDLDKDLDIDSDRYSSMNFRSSSMRTTNNIYNYPKRKLDIDESRSTNVSLFERPTDTIEALSTDNPWRKKIDEEIRLKQMNKNEMLTLRVKEKLSKKLRIHSMKDLKHDKTIDTITVVFPLPSKDPLIVHRKINDLAEAMQIDSSDLLTSFKSAADRYMTPTHNKTLSLSIFPSLSKQESNNNSVVKDKDCIIYKDAFLKPASVFTWHERNTRYNDTTNNTNLNEYIGQSTNDMKVSGVISPELGAHVLLKFTNKSGYDLGEAVISLSHLITSEPSMVMKTEVKNINISSGGQRRGEANATFALRYLPDNNDGTANNNPLYVSSVL